jgi:secondary thiamine-phosphate synthase enzyme
MARSGYSARQDGVVETEVLEVDTSRSWLADLTEDAARFCRGRGDGLLHVFAPHATAGVALIELGSGTEHDLRETLDRLLPRDGRWRHAHGSAGHGADHVLPALVSPSLSIPVLDGRLALGTWQSLVLVDTNRDNPHRQVRLSFLVG